MEPVDYKIELYDKEGIIPVTDSRYKTEFDNIYKNLDKFQTASPENFIFENIKASDGFYLIKIIKLDAECANGMIEIIKNSTIPKIPKSYLIDMISNARDYFRFGK